MPVRGMTGGFVRGGGGPRLVSVVNLKRLDASEQVLVQLVVFVVPSNSSDFWRHALFSRQFLAVGVILGYVLWFRFLVVVSRRHFQAPFIVQLCDNVSQAFVVVVVRKEG